MNTHSSFRYRVGALLSFLIFVGAGPAFAAKSHPKNIEPPAQPAPDAALLAQKENDENLQNSIRERLLSEGGIPLEKLQISSNQGVVTLSGELDNFVLRRRAAEAAKKVAGVQSVTDQINVPANQSDTEIRQEIESRIQNDPALHGLPVKVNVAQGVVTLTGTIEIWQSKDLLEGYAENARGVRDVRDNLHFADETGTPVASAATVAR